MIKALRFVLFFALPFTTLNYCLDASEKIQAIRDDQLAGTVELREYGGTTCVSLSNMAKALGGRLSWYRISSKVILSVGGRKLSFFFNSKKAAVDNKQIMLDRPTVNTGKDLFAPLDYFLSEKFSAATNYKIQIEEGKAIIIERMDNVSYPRIYTEDNFTRLVIDFTDNLRCDLKKKSKKEYSLLIYGGRVSGGKLDFQNEQVKQISLSNEGRTAVCRIKLKDSKLKLEMTAKDKPNRVIVDILQEKTTGEKFTESGKVYETASGTSTAGLNMAESTYTVIAASPPVDISGLIAAASVPEKKPVKRLASLRPIKIMLDPGHGGEDPGAVGYNGTKEKDINLKIALETEKLLADDGYEVILTRRDDTFIPLAERTNIANEKKADFFISIHCNASMKKTTRGFEIYFLSEKATDPDAEATARLENAVIKLEGPMNMRRQKLQEVLWRMAVNEFMNESAEICSMITNEVVSRIKMENRGIRQAGFFVLRGAQMPAVLVECAFLTNPAEEAKLHSGRFQRNISDSIFNGIRKYVQRKNNVLAKKK